MTSYPLLNKEKQASWTPDLNQKRYILPKMKKENKF